MLLLQAASNTDKHRTIYATFATVAPRDVHRGTLRIAPPGYFTIRKSRIATPGTPIETGAEIGRMKVRTVQVPPPNVKVGVYTLVPMGVAFRIDGRPDITQRDVWPMINEAWKVVLRVEKAAGIDGLPLPQRDWSWTP